METSLFKNWHLGRVLYLLFGLFFLVDFFINRPDWTVLVLGGLLIGLALSNRFIGCLWGSCSLPQRKSSNNYEKFD